MSEDDGWKPEVGAELDRIIAVSRHLLEVDEETASGKPAPGKWSPKEIIGHLIDSAANNHHRFVRLQHEQQLEFPGYEQDEWVRIQHYKDRDWKELVILWATYNRHLLHVIRHVDPACLERTWTVGEGTDESPTLRFLMEDYFDHMRHHLSQIKALIPDASFDS